MSFDLNEEKLNLVNLVCASLFSEPRFNQENDPQAKLIATLVSKIASKDPEFILKLSLYVRDDLNIRSTANFLLALASNTEKCAPFLKKYYHKTVRLPSDWLDVAALYQLLPDRSLTGRAIPTSLRKAMSQKFIQFDAYQLAKYNKENSQKRKRKKAKKIAEKLVAEGKPLPTPTQKQITLKQMIRQLHINQPVPHVMCILGKKYPTNLIEFRDSGLTGAFKEEKAGKRMKLPVPETWETVISSRGNIAEAWEELIDNRKLPFMAMLRNLRNLILTGISPRHHKWVMSRLKDEKTVANSRQFPFSFFTAYEAIDIDIEKLEQKIKAAKNKKGEPKKEQAKKKKDANEKKEKKLIVPKNMPTKELINQYKEALDIAVKYSTVHNVKPIRGSSVVFCNSSYDMVNGALSGRKIGRVKSLVEVGVLLGLMCKYMCEECDFKIVAQTHKSVELNPGNILDNMALVMAEINQITGSFSFPHDYFEGLILERKKIDNFLFLTNGSHSHEENIEILKTINKYRQEINPKLLFVKVNLSSGKSSLSSENLFTNPNDVEISGFSDAILRYVAEKGDGNQLDYIQHIDIVKNLESLTAKLDMRFNKQSYDSKPSQFWSFLDKVQNCKFDGCQVKLPKEKLPEHLLVCPYRTIKCSNLKCTQTMPANQLEIHLYRCPEQQNQIKETKKWRNVRVFISSTFLDMHGERDVLTRFVFPEIRDYCKSRKINFFEVDLRWGLIDEDGEKGSPLDTCLTEVDKCRPFFIGMLGDRYGWIPDHYKVSEDPNLAWLKEYPAGRSITELEMYYALLKSPSQVPSGRVFIRNSSLSQEIPDEFKSAFITSNPEEKRKLQELKENLSNTVKTVTYTASWGGVVDGKPVATQLEFFRNAVTSALKEDIDYYFPINEEPKSDLEIEEDLHSDFAEKKSRKFVGRKDILSQMFKYADSDSTTPLVIYGKPGFGKSAVVAKFTQQYLTQRSGFILPHFVGATPSSTDIRYTLWRICSELKKEYNIKEEIPETYKELKASFPRFLEQSSFGRPLIIVIDSINQLSETNRPQSLEWLPSKVPVKIILSTYSDTPSFEALKLRQPELPMIEVEALPEPDRKELVRQALFEYRKKLEETPSNNQMRLLLRKPDALKPLWLYIACEELRNFGIYEQVSDKIKSLGNNVPLLLTQLITRLEKDYGKELVSTSLSLIALSRKGLTEVELLQLLAKPNESSLPKSKWISFYRAMENYLKLVGSGEEATLTFFHNDLANVVQKLYLKTNDQIANAHKKLALFFLKKADPQNDRTWNTNDRRAISELPYHLLKAKLTNELESILTNLEFLNIKTSMGMVYELASDLYDAKEATKKDSGFSFWDEEESTVSPLDECWRFITSNSFILSHNSSLLYQQARNQPDGTTPCKLAELFSENRLDLPIWLNWKNKPTNFDACKLTLAGYADTMTACAFSPDGKRMVSGSRDRTLKIFETSSGKELATLVGHSNCVSSCAYSPDGRTIVSASWDNTLKLWDAEIGVEIATLEGHTRKVSCCVFSNDGKFILSGSWDFNLILWSYDDKKIVKKYSSHLKPINTCAFSLDDQFLVSGSWDTTVKLWNRESGECIKTFVGHTNSIRSVAFAPNGRQVASTSSDCTIRVWNVENSSSLLFLGHSKPVNSCAYSEDGKYLISASDDQTIKVWDALGGTETNTIKMSEGEFPNDIALSSDCKKFATAGNNCKVLVWDVLSSAVQTHLSGHSLCVNRIKFSPSKNELASVSDDKTVIVWNLANGRNQVLSGHTDRVKDLAYHPTGEYLISAGDDYSLIIWNLKTMNIERKLSGSSALQSCSFSPDGKTIITGGKDGVFEAWSFETGAKLTSVRAHSDWITRCSFSPDGSRVATCSWDFTAKIWSTNDWKEIYKCSGHYSSVTSLDWSTDGRLVTSSSDNTLRIWNIDEKAPITTLDSHKLRVNGCCWKDKLLVSCSEDGSIKYWDARVGSEITSLEGHSDTISSVALSQDKSQIISASEDCTVKVWDAKARKEVSSHAQWVTGTHFSPNGNFAVTVSRDTTVNIWNLSNYKKVNIYNYSRGALTACQFLPQSLVAFGSDSGSVSLWNYSTDQIFETNAHASSVSSLKVCSATQRLYSSSWDKSIKVWDCNNGNNLSQRKSLTIHNDWVNQIDVSLCGTQLLSASHDKTLKLTNTANFKSVTLSESDNWITSCAFSSNTNRAASGSFNSTLSLYDIQAQKQILSLPNIHESRINNVNFVCEDKFIVSTSNDRTVKVWDSRDKRVATSFVTKGAATSLSSRESSLCVGDSLGNIYFFEIMH